MQNIFVKVLKNHQILKKHLLLGSVCIEQKCWPIQKRQMFRMLNAILSNIDQDRIKEVGAERTCSEWLLRVGAKVRYKGYEDFKEDFNLLPTSNFEKYQIEEIDFTNTVAMTHGFAHLNKLKHVKKIKIDDGQYITNTCITSLYLVRNSLEHLQISNCRDVSASGIRDLMELVNLRRLILQNLPQVQRLSVKDKDNMLKYLQEALPKCEIDFFKEKDS